MYIVDECKVVGVVCTSQRAHVGGTMGANVTFYLVVVEALISASVQRTVTSRDARGRGLFEVGTTLH